MYKNLLWKMLNAFIFADCQYEISSYVIESSKYIFLDQNGCYERVY